MKKILMILGAVFVCLILVGIIFFSGLAYYANRLDKESKKYVDEVIPIIATSWNPQELINQASPEFLEAIPAEKIELLFDTFSKQMGPLKEYRGSTGKAKISITTKGRVIVADYFAMAVFEKASAKIEVRTIMENDRWQIVGFRVIIDIDALYKEKKTERSHQFEIGKNMKIFSLMGHPKYAPIKD